LAKKSFAAYAACRYFFKDLKWIKSRESMGFKILKAPKSANELLYLYFGGPLFYIEFSDGSREFALFNQLVTSSHSEDLAVHDYILIRIR
jgi:hypothetical protein